MTPPVRPRTQPKEVRSPPPPRPEAPPLAEEPSGGEGWRIALDRGGTFTDLVAVSPHGAVVVRKVPTDAADAGSDAAIDAIREIVGAAEGEPIPVRLVREVRYGTTAATNALLERRGEPCALLVTKGFADLLAIGTQERPDLFALEVRKAAPLASAVFEVEERVLADGTVRTPLDLGDVRRAAEVIHARGLQSAAVLFLHSYAFPGHEAAAGEILREAGIGHVVLSHAAAREVQAVPRGETASADAYLTPVLRRSLARFRKSFARDVPVLLVRSDGGLSTIDEARGQAAVLSGPAGGALAVAAVARRNGVAEAIGFDVGGTSTDVCRVAAIRPDGSVEPERRYETRAGGVRLRVPSLRVHTVAAGGGSVLSFDGRRFLVGPESAGAHPGPAGYGRGGPPTLTDADAVLGRLVPDAFPAFFGPDGSSRFDVAASREAIEPLARAAGLTVEEAADGFVRIADERVAQAIREESVLRGYDVRRHALVAFGGAGPQHACAVARALGVTKVIVPSVSSALSAWGMHAAERSWEFVEPVLAPLDVGGREAFDGATLFLHELAERRAGDGPLQHRRFAELRVRGSDATLIVSADSGFDSLAAAFGDAHVRAYGFPPPDGAQIEVVNVRLRVGIGDSVAPPNARSPTGTRSGVVQAHEIRALRESGRVVRAEGLDATVEDRVPVRRRRAWFRGADGSVGRHDTRVLASSGRRRAIVCGPALIVDPLWTVLVEPGWSARWAPGGDLVLEPADVTPPLPISAARDPVSLTLFANAFMSAAERMGAVLERTSHSTNIKERLDFSCAVFDGEGRLVANAPHIPVHLGAMGESVRAVAATRGTDLRDGDVILTNDPYRGGSHLPDVTAVTPVFVRGGRATFWVANRAHHADVGGAAPGSMPPLSRSIDEEGVCVHDLLVVRDGAFLDEAVRAAFSAARAPEERLFDFRAQAAANAEGARLLREMAETHGEDVVAAYMGHVLDDGAAAMEELLRTLPEGTMSREDVLDDGTPLRVAVTVRDGRATIDFEGTGPRSPGNLNAPRAVTRAAVLYAFRCLVRRPVPLNEGCLRPLEIRIPEGSLLDPRPGDAVVGGNVETSMRIVDLVLGALGACAASQGTMNNVTFGDAAGAYYETLGGGMGATHSADGASAVQCHMTNTRITDVEVLERRWPVVVRRFAVRRESGGAGARRGGDGLVREIEFLAPFRAGVLSERRTAGAPGIRGGSAGRPGRNVVVRAGTETGLPGRAAFDVARGDVLRIETPGGGGCGPLYDVFP